jgi:hypothetical protein
VAFGRDLEGKSAGTLGRRRQRVLRPHRRSRRSPWPDGDGRSGSGGVEAGVKTGRSKSETRLAAPEPFSDDRVGVIVQGGDPYVHLRHVDFNFRSHDIVGHLFLRCHHHDGVEERSKPSRREVTGTTFKGGPYNRLGRLSWRPHHYLHASIMYSPLNGRNEERDGREKRRCRNAPGPIC